MMYQLAVLLVTATSTAPTQGQWSYLREDQRPTAAHLGKIDFDTALALNRNVLELALGPELSDEERRAMELVPERAFTSYTGSDYFRFHYKGAEIYWSPRTGKFRSVSLTTMPLESGKDIGRDAVDRRAREFFRLFNADPKPHVMILNPSQGKYSAHIRHVRNGVPIDGGSQCQIDRRDGRILAGSYQDSVKIDERDKVQITQLAAYEAARTALSQHDPEHWIRLFPQHTRLEYSIPHSVAAIGMTEEEKRRERDGIAIPMYSFHAAEIRWHEERERSFNVYYVTVDARNGRVMRVGKVEVGSRNDKYPPEPSGLWSDEPLQVLDGEKSRTVLKGRLTKLDPKTETPVSGKRVTIANRLYICRLWFDEKTGLVWDRTKDRRWVARANPELARELSR